MEQTGTPGALGSNVGLGAWVQVAEMLPRANVNVLMWVCGGAIIGYVNKHGQWFVHDQLVTDEGDEPCVSASEDDGIFDFQEPTHWMALPAGPTASA